MEIKEVKIKDETFTKKTRKREVVVTVEVKMTTVDDNDKKFSMLSLILKLSKR